MIFNGILWVLDLHFLFRNNFGETHHLYVAIEGVILHEGVVLAQAVRTVECAEELVQAICIRVFYWLSLPIFAPHILFYFVCHFG